MNNKITDNQLLSSCELFSGLGESGLEKVAALVSTKTYEAGAALFQAGEDADELFIIQEGKIALQILQPAAAGQEQRQVTVDILGNGEVVGWAALTEPYSHAIAAVCLQSVKVLSINGNKLRWLLQDDREIAYEILSKLVKVIASRLDDTRHLLISERVTAK